MSSVEFESPAHGQVAFEQNALGGYPDVLRIEHRARTVATEHRGRNLRKAGFCGLNICRSASSAAPTCRGEQFLTADTWHSKVL